MRCITRTMMVVSVVAGLLIGCSSEKKDNDLSKDEARKIGKADWPEDYCELFGWYDDGICDDFCPLPDPDCEENLTCGPWLDGGCPDGTICDLRTCGVGGGGECVPEFDACPEIYAPVCSCDGETYGNDCFRLLAGAALDHEGECDNQGDICGGIGGFLCPPGLLCDYAGCYPDAMGTCVEVPDACPEIYGPVCGCDGETYANDCFRQMAGAALDHEGECEVQTCGGIGGFLCPAGQFCEYDGCYPDAMGTCMDIPDACPEIYGPVCGCDGMTYDNDCFRQAAGAALDHEGECQTEPWLCEDLGGTCMSDPMDVTFAADCEELGMVTLEGYCEAFNHSCCGPVEMTCGPWMDGDCPDGFFCDILGCGIGTGGVCVQEFDACPEIYAPVCGCDGETYGNDCYRQLAGAALDHEGECE